MIRTRIKPRSKKGAARARAWAKVSKEVIERDHGVCQAAIGGVCQGRATESHHLLPRGRGGKNEASNAIAVCHACHMRLHDHPREAAALGMMFSQRGTI